MRRLNYKEKGPGKRPLPPTHNINRLTRSRSMYEQPSRRNVPVRQEAKPVGSLFKSILIRTVIEAERQGYMTPEEAARNLRGLA